MRSCGHDPVDRTDVASGLGPLAGYVGPSVLGLGAAWLLSRGYVVGLLRLLLVALAVAICQWPASGVSSRA